MVKDYTRKITHNDYPVPEGKVKFKWLKGVMEKRITNPEKCEFDKRRVDNIRFLYPTDKYYYMNAIDGSWITLKILGQLSIFFY